MYRCYGKLIITRLSISKLTSLDAYRNLDEKNKHQKLFP